MTKTTDYLPEFNSINSITSTLITRLPARLPSQSHPVPILKDTSSFR